MNWKKVIVIAGLLAAFQLALGADNYYVSDGETKIGEWNSNILQTLQKGEEDNIPVVMLGTAFGCSICANFKASVLPNAKFKQWVANSPYYFLYGYSGSGWWTTKELRAFVDIVGNGGLPRVGGYWKKKDGTVIKAGITGGGLSADYVMSYWDKLFKDYDPNVNDQWDPADDTKDGATDLGSPISTATSTDHHYLNATGDKPDKEDWFKLNLTEGKRYSFYLQDDYNFENGAPNVDVQDPSGNVIKTLSAEAMISDLSCVFTAETNGTYHVRFYYEGNTGKAKYKLAYREFEEVTFGFKETSVSVKENGGNAVLALTRSGRMTDSVSVIVVTSDDTAIAGTDYTATSNTVTFAANKTEATANVPVIDIPGNQGNKHFFVACVNPEDGETDGNCTVEIEDLDIPTDAKDPGDDERSGATEFTITDETQTVKTLEGASRVVSGQDAADWYKFSALEQGKTYQIKVPAGAYAKRPASAESDPAVQFFVGDGEEPFATSTLATLMATPYRFTAQESGDLTILVKNEDAGTTVFTYDLAWQEWVLPVVSFTNAEAAVCSAGDKSTSMTVTLKRTKNLEEAITVQVTVSAVEGRVADATSTVTFAAGADTATFSVPLLADGGMWTPNVGFIMTILEDDAVHQNAEGAIHEQAVTLKTAMSEFDADDGEGNANANALNATPIEMGKRPTTRGGLTLNGSDKDDWYKFAVEKDVEYVFEIVDVLPESDETLPLSVEIQLPGENSARAVPLDECIGAIYHFIPGAAGSAAVGIHKTADDPQSIAYGLKYREWVPATIGLATNEIEVSEFANSVRIPVKCDMEVPLPVTVAVKTMDGTAKAGEDYIALDTTVSWDERSPTSSVKYATVNLKKLVAEYEGAFEQFEVYLDFSDSEGIAGDCTSLTVTIREADIGSVGTFAIAGYSLDGGSTLNKYQAKQIPVTEGDELQVKVVRTDGNAGDVEITLTWTDGTTAKATMADLETEVWIDAYIPGSEGQYVARQIKSLTLATDVKNAKTKNAKLNFAIADADTPLQAYAANKANIPATSAGNAWYVGTDGFLRTKTSTKVNETMAMKASLKGPGTLSFKKLLTGSGTITVQAGRTVLELAEQDDVVTAQVPSGTQQITVSFKADSEGAFLAIDEFTFAPDDSLFRVGTFYGDVVQNGELRGLATLTAKANGQVSGKFMMPASQTWTVKGKLVDGAADDAVVRRLKVVLEDSSITVAGQGELDAKAGTGTETEFDVIGARSGWSDRPLVGAYAENVGVLGQTIAYSDEDGELTFKVGANGSARITGTYQGNRISASPVLFARDGKLWAVLVNSKLPNGILFKFVRDDDGWSATKED